MQGDVVGIVDTNGNLVVEYSYDAWGKPISITRTLKTTLGELNPFRYRGYVWDAETRFYYVASRYYMPIRGRFANADGVIAEVCEPLWHNAYCYCLGMPVISVDVDGKFAICALFLGAATLGFIETLATAVIYTAAVVMTATVIYEITNVIVEDVIDYAKEKSKKTTKKTGKEKASDKPSWANPGMVERSKTPQVNAEKMLNDKYGPGNWKKGPGTEYNKIIKWIVRSELAVYASTRPTPRQLQQLEKG